MSAIRPVRESAGAWMVGLLAALALVAGCDGRATPTEVVSDPVAAVVTDAPALEPGQPGEVVGCPAGYAFATVDDSGSLELFTPDASACVTKIIHFRRTMTVELELPEGVARPSHVTTLDFDSTGGWTCPMPGPMWDEVCPTDDYSFKVWPDGRFRGKCHIRVD